MKIQLLLVLMAVATCIKSQSLGHIRAHYFCDVKGKELDAVSKSASIQLNLNDGQFVFRDVLGAIVTEQPAYDTLLDNYKETRIMYEGNIQQNVNDFLVGDPDKGTLTVSGNLVINGIMKSLTATCTPVRFNKSANELYMNFKLTFNPADFNLQPPAFPFTNDIDISVVEGYVNKIE